MSYIPAPPYLGAEAPADGRHASTPRDKYILRETEETVAEINAGGGQAKWKQLQIDGAEEQAARNWDEAAERFDAAFASTHGPIDDRLQAGFDAVALDDADLAQEIYDAKEAELEAAVDAWLAVAVRLAAAQHAEELAARRAA